MEGIRIGQTLSRDTHVSPGWKREVRYDSSVDARKTTVESRELASKILLHHRENSE